MGVAFIPLYIKYLGMEAYGLIGVFAMLQAWLTLLDVGMAPTLNREMARYQAGAINVDAVLDLLRSIEWVCTVFSLLIVMSIWLAAPLLSTLWLKVEKIPIETVAQAIAVMGFVVAAKLWEEVYRAAIRGMQHQVWLNTVQAILATARWAGVLVVLVVVSPSIKMFFLWQGLISVITVSIYAYKVYQLLPDFHRRGKFSINALKSIRSFAGGMAVITLLVLLLTQVDKLLLSGLLSLEQFGYYALASVVASGLAQLVMPMNAAIYPKFTELITHNDQPCLIKTYHNSCQLLSAIIVPPAFVLAAFAKPILLLWTGDPLITTSAAPILSLLILGSLFNGFMNVPYMLQLAYGWTGLAIRMNIVAVVIVIPMIFLVVPKYGAIGVAWVWLMLNACYVFIGVHFMYRRIITEQKWLWYRSSIISPLVTGAIVAFGLAYIMDPPKSQLDAAITVVFASICVLAAVILALPSLREKLARLVFSS